MWGGEAPPAPDLMQWKEGGGDTCWGRRAGGRVNSSQIITIAVFFEVFASKTFQWYFASLAVDKKRIILKAACWRQPVIRIFQPCVGGTQLETESFTAPICWVAAGLGEGEGEFDGSPRVKPTLWSSAANRLIGEVVQSRRRPLLGLSHLRHYTLLTYAALSVVANRKF